MNRDHNAEAAALPLFDFDRIMHSYMLRTFRPFFQNAVSALELGCFEGAMTRRLRDEFPDLTVVDASADCIQKVRAIGRQIECIHGAFETVDLERKYDAIFLLHTLEHLDDPVAVLKRCKGWLRPEGPMDAGSRLFVAVPNAFAASRQIAVGMGIIDRPEAVTDAEAAHGHRRTYCLDTLLRDCDAAGLRSYHAGGIMFKPLANFQFDAALKSGIIGADYLASCYSMGKEYPELCASVYAVCGAG